MMEREWISKEEALKMFPQPNGHRVLTIQIEIVDKEQAAWIWDTHMNGAVFHGVEITAIHEGGIVEELYAEEEDQ